MKRAHVVAVIGLEDGPESCAGPGVLAALGPRGAKRVAVVCRRGESGAFRPGIAEAFACVGDPRDDDDAFRARLLEVVNEHAIDSVIAGNAHVARGLARHARELERAGVRGLASDTKVLDRLRELGLEKPCRTARIPALPSWVLPDFPLAATFLNAPSWPIALLADDGARRRAVDTLDAVRVAYTMRARGAKRISVFSPAFRQLVEVCLVVARDGRLLGACGVRVLEDDERMRPWIAVTIDDPELVAFAHKFALNAKLVGPLTLLVQRFDKGYALLDVQPCFPVWIEAVLREGPNLVQLALAAAFDARTKAVGSVPAGTLFSQTAQDIVIDANAPAAALLN